MIWSCVLLISLTLGWMLSPDVMVRLGSAVAQDRTLFLAMLALSALLAALTVHLIRHPDLRSQGKCEATLLLAQGIGRLPAMVLTLVSRMSLVLLLPTGLLVSAGFTFNEIFLYWFPNFGFSFLLLTIIVLLHLSGERVALTAQTLFIGTTLCCLTLLCLAGLSADQTATPVSVDTGFNFTPSIAVSTLLLFLGYDYATPSGLPDSRLPAFAALSLALLLFVVWSLLCLQYVAAEHLAATTLPHMLAALKIWGFTGHVLMGIAMISSVLAAVNTIFLLATTSLAGLARHNLLPGQKTGPFTPRRYVVCFGLIIGAFLAAGLAGREILETYIEAALILWLVHIGAQVLAAGRALHRQHHILALSAYALSLFFLASALYLTGIDAQTGAILRFSGVAVAATTLVSIVWLHQSSRANRTLKQT